MSILDNIKSGRKRAKVPPRDTSLVKADRETTSLSEHDEPSTDQVEANYDKPHSSKLPTEEKSNTPATAPEPNPTPISIVDQIQAELAQFPEIARRSNIRVDAALLKRLEQTCSSYKITLETFLEAAYTLFETNPEIQKNIIEEAQKRKSDRRRAGKLRQDLARLKTY